MRVFWRVLEYGARVLSLILIVGGLGLVGCVGLATIAGAALDDPLPFGAGEWVATLIPLGVGIFLYVLSGAFRGAAEEMGDR